jgi:hypothetical protein
LGLFKLERFRSLAGIFDPFPVSVKMKKQKICFRIMKNPKMTAFSAN